MVFVANTIAPFRLRVGETVRPDNVDEIQGRPHTGENGGHGERRDAGLGGRVDRLVMASAGGEGWALPLY